MSIKTYAYNRDEHRHHEWHTLRVADVSGVGPTPITQISEVSLGPKGAEWVRFVAIYQDSESVGYATLADLLDHHRIDDLDPDWEDVHFECRVDEECHAEEFWGALQGQRVGGRKLAAGTRRNLLDAIDAHRITPDQFAVLRSLPGWADGPEHATYALLIDGPLTA